MTVTALRPAPTAPLGFTSNYQTPPAAVRDAVLAFVRTFSDAPIAVPVASICEAFRDHAQTDVEKHLANTLVAVAWACGTQINQAAEEIESAAAALDRHAATSGHDECCGYNCDTCVPSRVGAGRCETCESTPHERLDFACSELLGIAAQLLTVHVHDELFAAAGRP